MALQHYNTPALQTAPVRQKVSNFLTPSIADLIFIQTVEGYRGEHPAYGTPHPDSEKWPNHVLCYVKQEDPTGAVFSYYYAAKREAQDLYNWEQTTADIGQTKFDAVKRTYFTLRSDYDEASISMGDEMADPEQRFDGAYVLAIRAQTRVQDKELDSIYVLDEQTFIKKVTLLEARYDEHVGRGNGNKNFVYYRGEYPPEYPKNSELAAKIEDIFEDPTHPYWGLQPNGTGVIRNGDQLSENWFAVKEGSVIAPEAENSATNPAKKYQVTRLTPLATDVLFVETGTVLAIEPVYGTPHYDTLKWPHHKLCYVTPSSGDLSGLMYDFYYVADRENQDLYNWEYSLQPIARATGRKLRTVVRTYIIPRAEFNSNLPAFNAAMPNVPANKFDAVYYYLDKEQAQTPIKELDSLYVIEKHTYVDQDLLTKPNSLGIDKQDLTPAKFRALVLSTVREELKLGDVQIPTLGPHDLSISEDQINPNIKQVKTVSRAEPTEDITLTGQRAYVEGTVATISDTLSTGAQSPDASYLIVQSEVTPLGDGRTIKETVSVDSWPTLVSSEWDHSLRAQVTRADTFIASTAIDTNAPFTSYRAVNKDRVQQITEVAPTDTLTNYILGLPTRIDLRLPNILRSVAIVMSSGSGDGIGTASASSQQIGESYATSKTQKSESSGSASIKPELILEIEQPWGSDLKASAYYFYIEAPAGVVSEDDLTTKLGGLTSETILSWPHFKPTLKEVVLRGTSSRATASQARTDTASVSPKSSSTDFSQNATASGDIQLTVSTVTIPPTLHGDITFIGDPSTASIDANAGADMSYIISDSPRYRFSDNFEAIKGQLIYMYDSGHLFICGQTISNATSFTSISDGVYVQLPQLDAFIPTTSDDKLYVGGSVSDTYTGGIRLKYSVGFDAASGDSILTYPSGVTYLTDAAVVTADATDFLTLSSGVSVGSIVTPGASLPEVSTSELTLIVNQTYVFNFNFSVAVNDRVIMYPSGHAFTVKTAATGSDSSTIGIAVKDVLNGTALPTTADTSFSINENLVFDTAFSVNAGDLITLFSSGASFICDSTVISGTTIPVRYYSAGSPTPNTSGGDTQIIINGGGSPILTTLTGRTNATSGGILSSAPEVTTTVIGRQIPIFTTFEEQTITTLSEQLHSNTVAATALVYPNYVEATTPTDIPRTGLYMVQSHVEPYKWNWLKCMAVVVDAGQFSRF